jgi:hypothetical protein
MVRAVYLRRWTRSSFAVDGTPEKEMKMLIERTQRGVSEGHPPLERAPKKRLLGIRIVHEADDLTGTDKLPGSYSDRSEGPYAIDRRKRGVVREDEWTYFNPDLDLMGMPTTAPEEDIRREVEEVYRRREAYHRGRWRYICIRAVAEVTFTSWVIQRLSSGGCHGIETDSGEDYFAEIAASELDTLRLELRAVGFEDPQIDAAMGLVTRSAP